MVESNGTRLIEFKGIGLYKNRPDMDFLIFPNVNGCNVNAHTVAAAKAVDDIRTALQVLGIEVSNSLRPYSLECRGHGHTPSCDLIASIKEGLEAHGFKVATPKQAPDDEIGDPHELLARVIASSAA